MNVVNRVHRWATGVPQLHVLTTLVRVLLALAFVPSGFVKIMNEPFTTLPLSDPVGYFFAGFFSAHGYYRFVGIAQWIAAGLLLFPRTATLGALFYLPIIVNIFVITVAIGPAFSGTRVVTGLMVVANVYLLCWDWDRWKRILPTTTASRNRHGDVVTTLGMMIAAGLGLSGVTSAHIARLRQASLGNALLMTGAGAVLGLTMIVLVYRRAGRAHGATPAE